MNEWYGLRTKTTAHNPSFPLLLHSVVTLPVYSPKHSGSVECVPEANESSVGDGTSIIMLRREAAPVHYCLNGFHLSSASLCIKSQKKINNYA